MKALLVGQGEGPGGDILLQLEAAISRGDHKYAATLAKELAKVKISSRLTEQEDRKTPIPPPVRTIKADMFVEDAVSAQGPITLVVAPSLTVAELKQQVEQQFEIPATVQKWILDKSLVTEDSVTLSSQGVDKDGARVYLYLVSPEEAEKQAPALAPAPAASTNKNPPESLQKGRYWNYEEDRWSVCNSDDDEDGEGGKKPETENPEAPRPNNFQSIPSPQDIGKVQEVVEEREGAEPTKEEEGQWEYHQEADKPTEEKKNERPKIEDLVAKHIADRQVEAGKGAAVPAPAVVGEEAGGWQCPVCTLTNPLESPGCQACTTERPATVGAAAVVEQEKMEVVKKENNLEAYKQLENLDIIPNAETFECAICYLDIEPGDGVVLRECLHYFCK